MADYNKILSLCVSKHKDSWLSRPFMVEKKVMATNSYVVVMIDEHLAPDIIDEPETDVMKVIPSSRNLSLKLSVAKLDKALDKVPDETLTKTCKYCEGNGTVQWHVELKNQDFYDDFDCPVCDGQGDKPNGLFHKEEAYYFKIGLSIFSARYIEILSKIAKEVKADEVTLVSQDKELGASVFLIDDVELLIMPVTPTKEQNIVFYSN